MSRPLARRCALSPARKIGDWVGLYGSRGYWLPDFNSGSDVFSLPAEVSSIVLANGSKLAWADPSTDPRALEAPDKTYRSASTAYDTLDCKVDVTFGSAYSGTLTVYILGWDQDKLLTVALSGVSAQSQDTGDTQNGLYLHYPLSVAAGVLHVDATLTNSGANNHDPVIAGVFFD